MKSLRDPCKGFIPQNNELIPKNDGFVGNMYFFAFKSDIISGIYTLNFEGGGYTFWKRNVAVFLMFLVVGGWKKTASVCWLFSKGQKPRKPGVSLKEMKIRYQLKTNCPDFSY